MSRRKECEDMETVVKEESLGVLLKCGIKVEGGIKGGQ